MEKKVIRGHRTSKKIENFRARSLRDRIFTKTSWREKEREKNRSDSATDGRIRTRCLGGKTFPQTLPKICRACKLSNLPISIQVDRSSKPSIKLCFQPTNAFAQLLQFIFQLGDFALCLGR